MDRIEKGGRIEDEGWLGDRKAGKGILLTLRMERKRKGKKY